MTRYADPDTVDSLAAKWTPAQLACRLGQHLWWQRNKTFLSHYTSDGAMVIRQKCGRGCGVERENEMSPTTGHLLWSHWHLDYSNAADYLLKDDHGQSLGRINHDGRARLIKRFIVGIAVREVDDDDE